MPLAAFIAPPVLLAIYYAVLTAAKPRGPNPCSIVVRYDAPPGLTPSAARYIWKGCVDQRSVACVFAGLATKGRISLERASSAYKITKTDTPPTAPALDPDEQSTLEWLFSNFLDSRVFHPQQESDGCISSLRGLLDRRLRGDYQNARYGWAVLGMFASFAVSVLVASGLTGDSSAIFKFTATLFLTCFMTGVVSAALLVPAVVDLLRGMGSIMRLILALVFTGMAFAAVIGISLQLSRSAPAALIVMVPLLVAMNIVAVPLLRTVTPKGIEAQRQIDGFREYLLRAEQDQLDRLIKPGSAPPSSASLLSYAIALEVKDAWGDELVNACFGG